MGLSSLRGTSQHIERFDGGASEELEAPTLVEPQPNGPLYVSGRVRILDRNGVVIREDTRMALCRCGQSRNKPFCDGSHEAVDFRA